VSDAKPQPRPWKETPGEHNDVIYNLGSHIIDQAYVLFGMPERVGCRVWDQRGLGVDEAVSFSPFQHDSELTWTSL
jgi:predicted dehydrogenase